MKNKKMLWGMFLMSLISLMAGLMSRGSCVKAGAGDKTFDPDGEYHAALGIQTATDIWIQRWGYYDSEQNEYYDTDNYDKLYAVSKTGEGMDFYPGEFEDAVIKGNGTYTVSLKGAELSGETCISQMHIATDIPDTKFEKVKFSNVKLTINGKQVVTFDEAYPEDEEPYLKGGAVILLFNHWRDLLIQELGSKGKYEDSDSGNGWELLDGDKDDISISFDVTGFNYDNPENGSGKDIVKDVGKDLHKKDMKKPDKRDGKGHDKKHGKRRGESLTNRAKKSDYIFFGLIMFAVVFFATLAGLISRDKMEK